MAITLKAINEALSQYPQVKFHCYEYGCVLENFSFELLDNSKSYLCKSLDELHSLDEVIREAQRISRSKLKLMDRFAFVKAKEEEYKHKISEDVQNKQELDQFMVNAYNYFVKVSPLINDLLKEMNNGVEITDEDLAKHDFQALKTGYV